MSAVIPDQGKQVFAGLLSSLSNVWRIRLYKSNTDPVHTTVMSDFTECNYSGYASITLTAPSVAATPDGSGRIIITWAQVTFVKSGATGNDVYGYYVDQGSSLLLWAERAATAPLSMQNDGDEILITPKLGPFSQFNNL